MIKGAKVIYADEPVSGLDPDAASSVMQDMKKLCEKEKITIVCALHQLELAEKYAARIWGLAGGRLELDIPGRA